MNKLLKEEEKKLLLKFVSNTDKNVFVLKNLPEVVKGALFSRYSRTSKSLREVLLNEFLKNPDLGIENKEEVDIKKAEEFYDRVLIGFGDDSIAELAFVHVAVENVSNLATKVLEDARIGISPLEKSTRYVYFDKKVDGDYLYYKPEKIINSKFGDAYIELMQKLFDTYSSLIPKLTEHIKKKFPKKEEITERAYKSSIRAKVCDILRGLLPAATLTNVGLAGNGRAFEYLIIKMRAHPLDEIKNLAKEIHSELKKAIPSFVKRAFGKHGDAWVNYFEQERALFEKEYGKSNEFGKSIKLVEVHGKENDVFAGIIYQYSNLSFQECKKIVEKMNEKEKEELMDKYFKLRKNRRHKPNRAFELVSYIFDITANFGAYRDLQRHRILTQFRQTLTTSLGYDVPHEIKEIGEEEVWKECMEDADILYKKIHKEFKHESQYVVPFAYNLRWMFKLNLREAFHLCELRSSEQGHKDYREIAIKMAKEIERVHPIIGKMMFLNTKNIELERLNAEIKLDKKIEELRQKYSSG